jgi:hypothetical protein
MEEDEPIEFRLAPQDGVNCFPDEVDEIMKMLEIEPLFISDESAVYDFYLEDEIVEKASKSLGIPINENDLIVDIARRLFKHRNG